MKVGDPNRAGGVYRARSAEARRTRALDPAMARRVRDTASVMGIPEAELTEKVRVAIGALLEEVDGLRRDLEIVRQRLTELETLADTDGLTPLLNRRAFVRELSRMLAFTERYGMPASLIYFDLNGFKAINDAFGHNVGDAALVHVAQLLLSHVRGSDVLGRLGGDEFGIVLAQADEEAARVKAESLVEALATTPFQWQGQDLRLSAAYGVCTFRPGVDPAEALAEADRSMYLRKRTAKASDPSR